MEFALENNLALRDVGAVGSVMPLTVRAESLPGSTPCEEADRLFRSDSRLRTCVVRSDSGILYLIDRREFDDQMVARLGYGRTLFGRRPLQDVFQPSPPLTLSSRSSVQDAYSTVFVSHPDYPYLDVLVLGEHPEDVHLLPVSELLQQTSRVYAHRAQHDALTGLANRSLLNEQLTASLAASTPGSMSVALIVIDLDRFKVINDSLGHDAGDALLSEIASRLQHAIRPGDLASRLGGDEFAILLRSTSGADGARLAAERTRAIVEQPIILRGKPIVSTASLGVAVAHHRSDAAELLREADTAMYEAKRAGGSRTVVFHPALGAAAHQRFNTERELHRGLEQGEFTAYFQPIVSMAEPVVTGFEALVRWNHPTLGVLPPGQFLTVAGETGLLPTIDRHVLDAACRLVSSEETEGQHRLQSVNVNVSAAWLQEPNFVRDVMDAIQRARITPDTICVEITEEGYIGSGPTARHALSLLREVGVRVAIDDFGTGYSSLDQVSRLEFDVLKLDRRFASQLAGGRRNRAIVRCFLDLAEGLEVLAVAEGVETGEQAAELLAMGCKNGQGYLYGRPEPSPRWTVEAPNGKVALGNG